MTPDETTSNSIAPVRNVAALCELVDRVQSRSYGLPGMATFYGKSGFGKTFASTYAAVQFGAIHVEVRSTWSQKKFCQTVLREIGGPQKSRSIADMVEEITEALARTDRPLLVDEADHLVRRRMIEIVRDIADGSQAPVVLIGEELLPEKLQAWERIHGRMLDFVRAEPASARDLDHMARIYAPGIEIAADLKRAMHAASRGSLRRISVNLAAAEQMAKRQGLTAVDMATWAGRDFWTGDTPALGGNVRRIA